MTFNSTIYADPEERADARERYYAFDDERAESEREFRHEREMEIPNPMRRVVTVSGEDVESLIEWGTTSEGTVYIESITDAAGECLIDHVGKGELSRIVEEINHFGRA